VHARASASLYAKTGDLFAMLFAGLTAIVVLVSRRRRVDSDAGWNGVTPHD
jgi:apolipoprotein N-acyltransferase